MRINNFQAIINGNMANTLSSAAYLIESSIGFAVQAVYTGSPLGTLQLNGSCDPGNGSNGVAFPGTVVNWTPISGATASVSGAGNQLFNVQEPNYRWLQIVYTPISGTGTLNVQVNNKSA